MEFESSLDTQGSSGHRTQFIHGKIWKARWASRNDPDGRLVTGTYDGRNNEMAVWSLRKDDDSHDYFKRECAMGFQSDLRDLLVINRKNFVVALNNGTISLVGSSTEGLSSKRAFEPWRKGIAAHALCGDELNIFAGYNDGTIAVYDSRGDSSPKWSVSELSSVHSLTMMTPNIVASSHISGAINVWDIREKPDICGIPQPTCSCIVTQLCDAVTAVASHPADLHMVGFGTSSGMAGLLDTRLIDSPIDSNALPLACGPVWEVGFHPDYPKNFYGVWNSGCLLHLEIGAVGMFEAMAQAGEASNPDERVARFSRLSEARVSELLVAYVPLNTFDVSSKGILVGSDNCILTLIERDYFA